MNHRSFVRLLPWLTFVVATPMLNHCGGTAEPGTETGNPPAIDSRRLHIELGDSGVAVVGQAGSVSPGANVSVTNRSTGDRAEAIAGADGSVNVVVEGSLEDEYEVTVSNAAGSQTVIVTATSSSGNQGGNGGASSSDGSFDPASESCEALESELGRRVAAGFSSAPAACETDADCVYAGWGVACYYQCGGSFLSADGEASARADVAADVAAVCGELDSRCTRQPASSCPPAIATTPACVDGVCGALDLSALSCEEIRSTASARFNTLFAEAPRACSEDSDCSLYDASLTCASGCSRLTAVAATAVPELTFATQNLQDRFCGESESRGCPGPVELPCPPLPVEPLAACLSGECVVEEPL